MQAVRALGGSRLPRQWDQGVPVLLSDWLAQQTGPTLCCHFKFRGSEVESSFKPSSLHFFNLSITPDPTTAAQQCRPIKMSWRNQGITGSNNIPLGKRRFGDSDVKEEEAPIKSEFNGGSYSEGPDRDLKRGRSTEPSMW